jgi:hypothetical protein
MVVLGRVANTLNDALKVSVLVVKWGVDLEKGSGSRSCDDGEQDAMKVL